jgi:hypothetical protein
MRKSQFIALLRAEACATADAVLATVKHSTKGCPYIQKWLSFYEKQSSQHVEEAMHKYAPETAHARSAHEAIRLLVNRIQRAAISWAKTGKVEGEPKELAQKHGFLGAVHSFASSKVGNAILEFIGGTSSNKHSETTLSRKAQNTVSAPAHDAAHVKSELGTGHSLDSRVQSQMSSAFGYSFSGVRVHTDSRAARISSDLNARAFTIGSDVAFASGEYKPGTLIGDALIAHELAHVVQQSGSSSRTAPIMKGPGDDTSLEHDADNAAIAAVVKNWGANRASHGNLGGLSRTAMPSLKSGLRLSRCGWRWSKSEDAGVKDGKVGDMAPGDAGTDASVTLPGPRNFAGEKLSEADKSTIQERLKKAKMETGSIIVGVTGAKFVLHDTSSLVSASTIKHKAEVGRGPLGSGVSAYVPKSSPATISRPNFYEERRPTTTEYEKAIDKFSKAGDERLKSEEKAKAWKDRRDAAFRKIWSLTQPAQRTAILDQALAQKNLSSDEIQGEKTGNKKPRGDADFNPGAENVLKARSTETMTTSSSWAIEDICKQVTAGKAAAIAAPGGEAELTTTCRGLSDYFKERQARVMSVTAVEIVQPGVKAGAKSQDTCNPKNPDIAPLDTPPYSTTQYESIRDLYLRAAFQAASFPEITTHFAVDAFIQGHCDPRCFDLGNLYQMIATTLGHAGGSTYGVLPSYGTRWGTNNVWWDDTICHKKHP